MSKWMRNMRLGGENEKAPVMDNFMKDVDKDDDELMLDDNLMLDDDNDSDKD